MRPPIDHRIDHAFYEQPTELVAQQLIGKALLHRVEQKWVGGWIVETEAYLHQRDPASHSARGQTASNASMYAKAGTLYVYPIHAKYCLNAVTLAEGLGAAVLIRAIEPVWNVDVMIQSRGFDDLRRLTRGPAMLCQSLSVSRSDDGRCLVSDSSIGIFEDKGQTVRSVRTTPRIGISKATKRRLRFIDPDSHFLSRPYTASGGAT